jgi:hypothetical protein
VGKATLGRTEHKSEINYAMGLGEINRKDVDWKEYWVAVPGFCDDCDESFVLHNEIFLHQLNNSC